MNCRHFMKYNTMLDSHLFYPFLFFVSFPFMSTPQKQIQWVVHVVSDVTTGSIHHFLNQQIRVLVNREPALHQGYSQSGYYCELGNCYTFSSFSYHRLPKLPLIHQRSAGKNYLHFPKSLSKSIPFSM